MKAQACEIRIGGQITIGTLPRVPLRFLLQRALGEAMGYTEADRQAMAEQEEGDDPIDPSLPGDGYAISCVYYAALGLCWPTELPVESIRALRHDVVAYGEQVFEHFIATETGKAHELNDEGRRLFYEMIRAGTGELTEAIKLERDFTGAQGDPSTVA